MKIIYDEPFVEFVCAFRNHPKKYYLHRTKIKMKNT